MPRLEYTARTHTGEVVAGQIRARSETEARESLGARGLEALTLQEPEGAASPLSFQIQMPRRRVPTHTLAVFTAQLSLMLRSGTALVEALEALAEQTQDMQLYEVIVAVRDQVNGGATLAHALRAHPRVFDGFYVNAVRAGEVTGRLPDVFHRLEQHLRKRVEVRNTVIAALIYPAIVTLMAVIAVIFMMTYVLPRFVDIFAASRVPLPLPTRMLMGVSGFLVSYWYIVILTAIAVPLLMAAYIRSPRGSRLTDGLLIYLPVIGPLVVSMQTALMLRTLGTLLASGVPLVEGLDVARDACKNTRFKDLIRRVSVRVTQGEEFSSSFARDTLLSPVIKQMLTTGERSGNLAKVMNAMADYLDESSDKQVKRLSAIFEPLLIIIMGIVIGFIAISVLLPLFQLTAAARGGA